MVTPGSSNPFDAWLPRGPCVGQACETPVSLDGFGDLGGDLHPPRPDARGMTTLLGDVPVLHPSMLIVDGAIVVDPAFPAPGGPWRPAPVEDFPILPPPGGRPPGDPSDREPVIVEGTVCELLHLPPFENLAAYTRRCFQRRYGVSDWPAQWPELPCPPPCVDPRPCVVPDALAMQNAADTVAIDALRELHLFGLMSRGTDFAEEHETWRRRLLPLALDEAVEVRYPREVAYVSAAVALLLENLDLVDWSVCLAAEFGARDLTPATIRARMHAGVRGAYAIYLVEDFWIYNLVDVAPGGSGPIWVDFQFRRQRDGATGGATDLLWNPAMQPGIILPIHHSYWRRSINRFEQGSAVARLGSLVGLAQVILHEAMHLAAAIPQLEGGPPPRDESDAVDTAKCWATQNMSAMAFGWALARRYGCLQGRRCLPKLGDEHFLSSEPALFYVEPHGDRPGVQPGLFGGVPKNVLTQLGVANYVSVEGMPWVPEVPC